MRRTPILVAGLLAAVPVLTLLPATAPAAASVPVHTLTVSGTDVGSYPAFDPAVERYAVTTTAATAGTLTVHATTSEATGVVRVDGRVAPGGTATVTGLAGGDEVSVFIEDSAGVEAHSLMYLPAGFPALETTTTSTDVAPGQIGLTLFTAPAGGARFATTVDRNGVPSHVLQVDATDLKRQPDGSITYSTPTTTQGRSGQAVVVLDDQWREVARHETVAPLTDTDPHDSILLPDGSRFLIAYEPNQATGMRDSVIQKINADGTEGFRWSSEDLVDETVRPPSDKDYAHLNSIFLMPDGDIVASFRHLSAVLRIATVAHDGYQPRDIVWKLGGRDSSFTFVDDPYGGPCAQHTASVLPNGHVLVFDDGSGGLADHLCVDQADPTGPTVDRVPWQSRVAEYALDFSTVPATATLVWDYTPPGWYTWFMGSARRLDNGNTLIGWAAEFRALASEVAPDGSLLWELKLADPLPNPGYLSYRASLMPARDAEAPVVDQVSLADGSTYAVGQAATVDFRCTDRGGSSLRTCGGDARPGDRIDTSTPGTHTLHLTAADGAGNTTTVTRHYTVTASYQPSWSDKRVRAALHGKRVSSKVTLVNDGTYADAFVLTGSRGSKALAVHYKLGDRDVTRQVLHGSLTTQLLQPGQRLVLRVVVARTERTRAGDHRSFTVGAESVADPSRAAGTKVVARAR